MMEKNPPQEPVNTITTDCDITMLGVRAEQFWKLAHIFLKEMKNFVQQLDKKESEREGQNPNWEAWKYYVYKPVIDKRNNMDYLIIFFLDDNNPEIIGVITVYPVNT